ncbi:MULTISPECIES: hypothetical protein [Ensifer]|uniref:Uncharacterized protein n=1 Tax=Ensifer canadensis TaxID=555315 RepID=A0AAW4FLW9_9HYPH|nr:MULTISPECIES: hypothetical protein [Ensifer]MDP9633731.1 hypothetical protein [Ensifer adhaerens]KQU93648.1 hypothetical protein ASD00_23495 [Ensifer sp. Root31]KQW58636.1 hypothetical protein ASD02_06510 [Ensifer sp. Root1252]KQW74342.1 hypothetical protein ASD03_07170 [Ensifer sp. Root127]KQY78675.1 hypothetical protein ASD52_02195 [Ensifer sp. Root142]
MFLQRTEIREHTIEVREFVGEGSVEIDERILFDDEDSHIVLLLEILAGDVTFTLRGPDVANLARDFADRVRLYIIPPARRAYDAFLEIRARPGSRFRAIIARIGSAFVSAASELSCRACKQVCKLLASTVLAYVGVPNPEDLTRGEVLHITAEQSYELDEGLGHAAIHGPLAEGPIGTFLALFADNVRSVVWSALQSAQQVFEPPDRTYTFACRRLGCCP